MMDPTTVKFQPHSLEEMTQRLKEKMKSGDDSPSFLGSCSGEGFIIIPKDADWVFSHDRFIFLSLNREMLYCLGMICGDGVETLDKLASKCPGHDHEH